MSLEVENMRYAHGPGHTDICFGSSDKHVLTCGSDGYVRIWDGIDDEDSISDFVADQALSVACTEELYLVATSNNYVQGYTYSDRKRDKVIFRFSAPVTHVVTSCSGKFIAAGSCDTEVQVLNTQTNKITTLVGHSAPILGLALDPMDEFVASSSCDGSIKIWNLASASIVKCFNNVIPKKNDFFKAIILGRCAWKSGSGLLFAIPKGVEIIVYKRNSWEESFKLVSKNIEKDLSAVMFSPCGNYMAAASSSGEIVLWEVKYKTEVCCYKDSKKVGISAMIWQPDGDKILFCDRLGRLGVVGGISDKILNHIVYSKGTQNFDSENSKSALDFNYLKEYEDEDENKDDDNCISLDKIKSTFNTGDGNNDHSDNDDSDHHSNVSDVEINDIEHTPSYLGESDSEDHTKRSTSRLDGQKPFQPTSTPRNFEPRCLCYNNLGLIRYYDSDKTIDVQFHDATIHHSLFLRSFGLCTMASLSSKVICLAVPSVEESLSKLTCIHLGSAVSEKEWTTYMPKGEDILAVATADNWVAVATSLNNLRIFTDAGSQKQIVALPGRIVCMVGQEEKLFIVCHGGPGTHGNQGLIFATYKIFAYYLFVSTHFQYLPLSPKSTLKWMGFSDEGTPSTYDDQGILRMLGQDSLYWMVMCDTKIQNKSPSVTYFVVGLSEREQNIRCIMCRNSQYPLFINSPTIMEIPMKMPMCEIDDTKSITEESFWRLMFSLHNFRKFSSDTNEIFKNFELPMTQAILKLFGDALNNAEDVRAVDLAHIMSKKPLDVAIKYASNQGRTHLVEKLKVLKPIDWTIQQPSTGLSTEFSEFKSDENEYFPESNNRKMYSQRDLFEDSFTPTEKENEESDEIENTSVIESENRISSNPFKKSNLPTKQNTKGLKYFDSLNKQNKPFNVSKPLKLKLATNSKEKKFEAQQKRPSFVEWFSKRKTTLSQKYPTLSSTELTKMSMKLYKENTDIPNDENDIVEVVDSDLGKRNSLSEPVESSPKRFKNSA